MAAMGRILPFEAVAEFRLISNWEVLLSNASRVLRPSKLLPHGAENGNVVQFGSFILAD